MGISAIEQAVTDEQQRQISIGIPSELATRESVRASEGFERASKQAQQGTLFLGLLVSGPASAFLFMWSRRLRSATAQEAMAADVRPPVIYFRSFRDDHNPGYALAERIGSFGRKQFLREEEEIVSHLKRIGPVVAIGDPKEKVPLAGASRLYSTNDEWQAVAHKLLSTAALVVYRLGCTPGIVWEVTRGRDHIEPERFVLLVPPDDGVFPAKEYASFRNQVGNALSLPETPGGPIILFRRDWSCETLGSWYRNFYNCLQDFVVGRAV